MGPISTLVWPSPAAEHHSLFSYFLIKSFLNFLTVYLHSFLCLCAARVMCQLWDLCVTGACCWSQGGEGHPGLQRSDWEGLSAGHWWDLCVCEWSCCLLLGAGRGWSLWWLLLEAGWKQPGRLVVSASCLSVCLWSTRWTVLPVHPVKGKAAATSLSLGRDPRHSLGPSGQAELVLGWSGYTEAAVCLTLDIT